MKIYRAMCKSELADTLKYNKPAFMAGKRFKWFSPTTDFIFDRVKDGKFNNSSIMTDRYEYVVEFDITDECLDKFTKCGHRELMLDLRKSNLIKINSIK